MSVRVLRAENQSLRREMRAANRTIDRLNQSNERKDREIARLITVHHTEKMFLLNNLDNRMNELMRLHRDLEGQLNLQENRVTTAPAEENKTHGFALTINLLPEDGAHEIRFIAGQEKYVTREAAGAAGLLFGFTETGNPIYLRQNFQRGANAWLRGRVGAYLRNHPEEAAPDIVFRCCRSKWVYNTTFPLEEVAEILTELLEETNVSLRLAALYSEVHSQVQDFIRVQRFQLHP